MFRTTRQYLSFNNREPEMEWGKSLMYLCPFHDDHEASLHVTEDEQGGLWKCFGCGLEGTLQMMIFLLEGYEERDWPKVYKMIEGRESITPRLEPIQQKKKRSTAPATDLQKEILSFLTNWWHERLFDLTGQARQARQYLAIVRGIANRVHLSPVIGYAPGDPDGSYATSLAKQIVARFGYHGLQMSIKLGIFRQDEETKDLTLRLQYRVMFSCLDPKDQRTAYYQGRIVEPRESRYPKIGPSGIAKMPFWIPIATPEYEGTFIIEAPMGVAALAYYQISAFATLGEGFDPDILQYFDPPFFCGQDNDVPKQVKGQGLVQAGEKQAQKAIARCKEAGYPAYRIEPERITEDENGMDEWIHARGIMPVLRKMDQALGHSSIREERLIV